MVSRVIAAIRSFVWLRRGWSGLVAGVAAGIVGTVLFTNFVLPVLRGPTRLEAGTITILSGPDDGIEGQRQKLVDQWNALPGLPKARIIEIGGVADDHHAELVRRAQAPHDNPEENIDIYNLDVTWIAEFAHFKYIRPLDTERVDTTGFLAKPLEACRYQGKLWGLPFNTDAGLLFYRSDIITGPPPSSWPTIVNTIDEKLNGAKAAHPELVAGFATQLDDYEGLTVNAFEAIWAAGGEVVNSDGEVVIDTPQAREGLRRLASGLAPGNPQHILPDSRSFKEQETTQAFRDGKVMFMRNWPVAYRQITSDTDSEPVQFQTAALARGSVLGGQNLAVATQTDQPRAAQKLIEFLTSERSQQILFERGGFAATRELVYQDKVVRDEYKYAETLLLAVRSARLRPVTAYYARFSAVFLEEVDFALNNGGQLKPGVTERLSAALEGKLS